MIMYYRRELEKAIGSAMLKDMAKFQLGLIDFRLELESAVHNAVVLSDDMFEMFPISSEAGRVNSILLKSRLFCFINVWSNLKDWEYYLREGVQGGSRNRTRHVSIHQKKRETYTWC